MNNIVLFRTMNYSTWFRIKGNVNLKLNFEFEYYKSLLFEYYNSLLFEYYNSLLFEYYYSLLFEYYNSLLFE